MKTFSIMTALVAMLGCKSDERPKASAPAASGEAAPKSVPAPQDSPAPSAAPAAPAAAASHPDLDRLCARATEILAAEPNEQRARWSKAVREIADPSVKKGFQAIGGADGEMQVELGKQVAKEVGVPSWDCPDYVKLVTTMK